jgi:hypothetical protein
MIAMIMPSFSYGDDRNLEFGTRFLPSKLVEKKEGTLQVFAKKTDTVIPEKINGLTVTSLDSSILRVIGVKESDSGFVSEVTLSAIQPGMTKLFLAAPGFSPTEIPVTVYGNKLNQAKFLVKTTPATFSSDGPFRGFVSVELADEDGFPVYANVDIPVSLTTSNSIIEPFQKNLTIKKGEYFTGTQFTVRDSGKATIVASGNGMNGKSNEITVGKDAAELTLGLYVFPEEINISSKRTVGHIIAVLQEGDNDATTDDDNPVVIAKKDITVKYKVTNSIFDDANISSKAEIGESSGLFTIKKGTYWGHTTFELLGGDKNLAGTYDITISSGDPISLKTKKVKAVFDNDKKQEGDKFIKLDTIPISATGNQELIGVLHIEDKDGYPIVANKNLEIKIDSSDDKFITIDPTIIKTGDGSALVFGTVGHAIPTDQLKLNAATEVSSSSPELIEVNIFGTAESNLKLVAEPLISKVLSNSNFPVVLFMKDGDGITQFPRNSNLFISQSEYFEVEPKQVSRGDDLIMLDAKAFESGKDTLQFSIDNYETSLNLEGLSLKPATLHIDHTKTLFKEINDVFSVQLLNPQGLPVFATEDVEIKLVVKNENLLQVPQSVTIKKGNYYALFDVGPKQTGETQLSVLAEGIPLTSTTIKITSLKPTIEMTAPTIIESGEAFITGITAKQDNLPLQGLDVVWNVEGGLVQISDKKTGATGEAKISIIPTSDSKIDIEATVSGSFYSANKVTKTVRVNSTSEFVAFAEGGGMQDFTKFEIAGIDPVIIVVPAAIGIVGYTLKKKGIFNVKPQTTTAT